MTNVGYLQVPKYLSMSFNRRLSFEDQSSKRIKLMVERVYLLIDHALDGLPGADWIIDGTKYQSAVLNEPYGVENDGVMIYIYGEERGKKSPIAIFKDMTLAADYFVWLASKGQRKINWTLFLDMTS